MCRFYLKSKVTNVQMHSEVRWFDLVNLHSNSTIPSRAKGVIILEHEADLNDQVDCQDTVSVTNNLKHSPDWK